MRSFADLSGNRWRLHLNIGAIDRIKADCGLDLFDPEGCVEQLPQTLQGWIDILAAVLARQLEARRMMLEDFAERVDAEILLRAKDLLIEELIDFFQRAHPVVGALLAEAYELSQREQTTAQQLADDMRTKLRDWSAELTPGTTPCEN